MQLESRIFNHFLNSDSESNMLLPWLKKPKYTLDTIFQFAIASEMYSGVGNIIKYISQKNLSYTSEENYSWYG
jgi:hypothetical protein